MKKLILVSCLLLAAAGPLMAASTDLFPKGEKAANVHHTGDVWLSELAQADDTFNYNISYATFAAGAKLNWHSHPGGQILLITEGVGYYQERGKPVQLAKKGDVIKCPADAEHWHAATPDSSFAYIATTMNHPKGRTLWLESVTDSYYLSIQSAELNTAAKAQQE
jgi:quercetin dioxygenase-like cupin family protein